MPGEDELEAWITGILADAADDEPGWEAKIAAADRLLDELDNQTPDPTDDATEGPRS